MDKSRSNGNRTIAPQDFPVELAVLFEQASMATIRVPVTGAFENKNAAFGSMMVLTRWRSAMTRSKDCPKAFLSLIQCIQFKLVEDSEGWHYTISPLSENKTMQMVKDMVPSVHPDEFWSTYKE